MLRALAADRHAPSCRCSVQVGVNRGHVFAAEIGSPGRAAYSAMGDTTNTAARIAAKAPAGRLYAHPSRARAGPHPLRVASPSARSRSRASASRSSCTRSAGDGPREDPRPAPLPMLGRERRGGPAPRRIDRVRDGRRRRAHGHGRRPGSARPTRRARRSNRDRPADGHRPRRAVRRDDPYRPLRDPLRQLLGVERADRAAMTAALLARLDGGARPACRSPRCSAPSPTSSVPPTPEVDAIADRHRPDRTADVLIELLGRTRTAVRWSSSSRTRQWVDEATAHLLGRLAAATIVRPWLLIVAATRRPRAASCPTAASGSTLGTARATTCVRTLANRRHRGDTAATARDRRASSTQAAGSPLFIEEMGPGRPRRRLARRPSRSRSTPPSRPRSTPRRRRPGACSATRPCSAAASAAPCSIERAGTPMDSSSTSRPGTSSTGFFDRDGDTRLRFRNGLVRDVVYEAHAVPHAGPHPPARRRDDRTDLGRPRPRRRHARRPLLAGR